MSRIKRLVRRIKRVAPVVFARVQLVGCEVGFSVGTFGVVTVSPRGLIRVGHKVSITGGLVPTKLIAHRGARLEIGPACMLNAGSHYEAHDLITIGRGCLIASGVRITDVEGERRGPVIIEDNVWIAHGATVMPGVRVGTGSVVSAGSVVVNDVPAHSIVIGNPGRAVPLSLAQKKPS